MSNVPVGVIINRSGVKIKFGATQVKGSNSASTLMRKALGLPPPHGDSRDAHSTAGLTSCFPGTAPLVRGVCRSFSTVRH